MKSAAAWWTALGLGLVLALGAGAGGIGCSRGERKPEPGSSTDKVEGPPLDRKLMLTLATARAYHHQADVYVADGNNEAALDVVRKITQMTWPDAPEAQEALDDAFARLAKLELAAGRAEEALAIAKRRLEAPVAESFFRSNLISVQGELLKARAEQLDATDRGAASALRREAIATFQRAIEMNERLQLRLLEEESQP